MLQPTGPQAGAVGSDPKPAALLDPRVLKAEKAFSPFELPQVGHLSST